MRYKSSLLIAVTVMMLPLSAQAELSWNPVNWFMPSKLEQAQRAHQQAVRAEARAARAQRAAEAAKKRAEETKAALEAKKAREAKPVAQKAVPESRPVEKQASAKTLWNPMNWFGTKSTPPTPITQNPAVETQANKIQDEPQAQLTIQEKPESTTLELASTMTTADKGDYLALAKQMRAVTLETQKGNIVFELYPDEAPVTVANFVKLVSDNFYNQPGMKFHRVVPGFVIQTGDPTGTGAGGSKDRIPLEIKNKLSHDAKGIVAMARGASPNSATSQFYITLAPQKTLDAKYAVFGRVVSGLDVLDKIEKGDIIYGARLTDLRSVARDDESDKKNSLLKWLN